MRAKSLTGRSARRNTPLQGTHRESGSPNTSLTGWQAFCVKVYDREMDPVPQKICSDGEQTRCNVDVEWDGGSRSLRDVPPGRYEHDVAAPATNIRCSVIAGSRSRRPLAWSRQMRESWSATPWHCAAACDTRRPMAIAPPLRATLFAVPLIAMLSPAALSAQAEPMPSPAETPAPEPVDTSTDTSTDTSAPAPSQPSQDVPLVQLEGPAEHVVTPQPIRSPEPAPALPAPPPPVPAPPPAWATRATSSPCAQPEDAYRHDGFYLRVLNETQYLAFVGSGPDGRASVKGLGAGGLLALGGTPLPGLVVAGTLGSSTLRGKFVGRPQGEEENASMARAELGVLVDWYPQPNDGWHIGAALGFAGITLTDSSLSDAVGVAFSAKVLGGYDWWIGPQWALGLAAVLAATPSTPLRVRDGDESGYRFHTLSVGLAGTLTLH